MATGQAPGEGPIVHRWDLFEDAPDLVEQRFTDMEEFAREGYNMAFAAIQALVDIAGSLTLIDREVTIDTTPINPSIPEFPDPPVIDLDLFNVDFPSAPFAPNLIEAQLDPIPTTFPEMIGPGEPNPGDSVYLDNLMTALKNKLLSDLQTGSTGIPDNIQNAMFQRNLERDLLEYDDEQDRVSGNWAKGGFPYPNGGLRAAKDRTAREFSAKRLDLSREIMIKSWEIALNNYHFVVQQIVATEALLIKWAESVAMRTLEASKIAIDAQIRGYEARVKGFSERVRVILEKLRAKIEYNLGLIRTYEASVNAYSARVRAEAERVNAVATGYKAQTDVFSSIVDFDVKVVDLELKVISAKIEQALGNAQIMIKDKEVELRAYEALMNLKAEAQKAIGTIAAHVAAGALSAVHAQVSIGAQNSADYFFNPNQVPLNE